MEGAICFLLLINFCRFDSLLLLFSFSHAWVLFLSAKTSDFPRLVLSATKSEYVYVGTETFQAPCEPNGTLSLATVQSHFPCAGGLWFQSGNQRIGLG